jgi:hypothetical protein
MEENKVGVGVLFPPKEQTDMAGKWLNLQTQDFMFE